MGKADIKKLSEEQIKAFEELKKETQELNYELGRLERQKWLIENAISSLKNEKIPHYDETEKELLKSINEEYGDGRLDLSTYEFVKQEKE